jgi:hypothetical protein
VQAGLIKGCAAAGLVDFEVGWRALAIDAEINLDD